MHVLKPEWVRHEDEKPIFSVDIHPRGGRFATGGQGGQGGRIVIWNIAPVLSEAAELDPKIPKQLCQMDNHLACVNVVRWSCKGHMLASGSDDKLVMIWKLTGEGGNAIFGATGAGAKVNVETWKCVHTLNAHNGDVLDLAWAPHDGWLASASVDNTVIVWNALKLPEKVAVLKGHSAMVKGVTWDPVGKYLASQSDDKSLRVWRTVDWTEQVAVTDPFADCSATTHVLRCNWSPDGQYLVSAHAMNGGGPTAQIIERDSWKHDKDFVGHRKAVTCVRFSGSIMQKKVAVSGTESGGQKPQQYCCCAIGSRDRAISIWPTSLRRPLIVMDELFDDSVLDISWGSNGRHLLACSCDGTVACIIFEADEIGMPLTQTEKNALYERMYGKSLERNLFNPSFTGSQIIESADMLPPTTDTTTLAMDTAAKAAPIALIRQPSSTTPELDPILSPQPQRVQLVAATRQVETRLPSGKRRITPMLLKAVPTNMPAEENDDDVPTLTEGAAFSSSSPKKSKVVVVNSTDSDNLNQLHMRVVTKQVAPPITKLPAGIQINRLMCSEVPGDQPIERMINILDPLKLPNGQTVTKKCDNLKLQITNGFISTSRVTIAKIEVFRRETDKQPISEIGLGSTIRCVQCNGHLLVACCEDLTINAFLVRSGALAFPPLVIEDVVSVMCLSQDGKCLVLTRTGLMHMWDLTRQKSLLNRVSVRSILSSKESVSSCTLSSTDTPVITLNDGRSYTYSLDFGTWMVLSNPLDPLSRSGGTMARSGPGSTAAIPTPPLAALQRCMPLTTSADSMPAWVLLAFLERQIAASRVLQSPAEFKYWLLLTVGHLLDKGPEVRLRAILDDLLGPTYAGATRPKQDQSVIGIPKTQLLREILEVIKTKIPWQRLYKEYSEQLP